MNRPSSRDYDDVFEFAKDLIAYCEFIDEAFENACKELEYGWTGRHWGNPKTFWNKDQWKEYLREKGEKKNG